MKFRGEKFESQERGVQKSAFLRLTPGQVHFITTSLTSEAELCGVAVVFSSSSPPDATLCLCSRQRSSSQVADLKSLTSHTLNLAWRHLGLMRALAGALRCSRRGAQRRRRSKVFSHLVLLVDLFSSGAACSCLKH